MTCTHGWWEILVLHEENINHSFAPFHYSMKVGMQNRLSVNLQRCLIQNQGYSEATILTFLSTFPKKVWEKAFFFSILLITFSKASTWFLAPGHLRPKEPILLLFLLFLLLGFFYVVYLKQALLEYFSIDLKLIVTIRLSFSIA